MRQRGQDVFSDGTDEHGERSRRRPSRRGFAASARRPTTRSGSERSGRRFNAPLLLHRHRTPTPSPGPRGSSGSTTTATLRGDLRGLYCPRCADFKTPTELGPGNTARSRDRLELETEQNWFFRLSTFQQQLERLYDDDPTFVQPTSAATRRGVHQGRAQRRLAVALEADLGVPLPWTPASSCTSGSTRSSTTTPPSPTPARAMTGPTLLAGDAGTCGQGLLSSPPSTGRRCARRRPATALGLYVHGFLLRASGRCRSRSASTWTHSP